LAQASKGAGFEASLNAGLEKLTIDLMSRDWKREDGTALRIRQLLIDANWGQSTQTIRTFARRSAFAASILPSHGRGVGASGQPIAEKSKGRGDRLGLNWRIGQISAGQRSVLYDTNFWKTFVTARMRLALGDPESISINQGSHDLLIEHFTAEYPVRVEARGRVVDEWKLQGRDNHWFDCMVGAAVAASIAGVRPQATEAGGRSRRKVSLPSQSSGRIVVTRRSR
jgi:phage terminase large subunit GpA-like protein